MTTGHQILTTRSHERSTPAWAMDDLKIRAILLKSFPKLKDTTSKDAERAGRWARIIHLYFRMKRTHGQIAEEMSLSYDSVRALVRSIKRAFEGRRCDGSGVFSVYRAGRPRRKSMPQLKHPLEAEI